MCVSSRFCESHLRLLFTILVKSTSAVIRSNIIIAIGDMATTFSTLIDENIHYLYNRLSDSDVTVKKNTLMVLTHLILNGMVKVKGQLSEMAKCLEDPDPRIVDLSKLFFTELAAKDNALYNNLPDIISNLSTTGPLETITEEEEEEVESEETVLPTAVPKPSLVRANSTSALSSPELSSQQRNAEITVNDNIRLNQLTTKQFRAVMRFLFDFIKKDKQADNLVEKLCTRFRTTETPRQWADISFCLSLLPYNTERSVKKLAESLPQYQDKLHIESVYRGLMEVLNKAKKTLKTEGRTACVELETQLTLVREKALAFQDTSKKAHLAVEKARGGPTSKQQPVSAASCDAPIRPTRLTRGQLQIQGLSSPQGMEVDTESPRRAVVSDASEDEMNVDR